MKGVASKYLISTAVLSSCILGPTTVLAACIQTGNTYNCTGTDQVAPIGSGPATPSGTTVNLDGNASIDVSGNQNAVSLGDNASITLQNGASISNAPTASTNGGLYQTGYDTVEFNNNGTLLVNAGASIRQNGPSAGTAEAVNVEGAGNTITNYGTIYSAGSAAIWFQDSTIGAANTVDNYGTIETGVNGGNSSVIGNSGNGAVHFINQSGATVIGNISFSGGDDSMTLYTGSTVTGSIDGGGGTNSMVLRGSGTATLQGPVRNFSTLTKEDSGMWTLTGTMANSGATGNTPIAVDIQQGTLAVGDAANADANIVGNVSIEQAGVLAGYGTVNGNVTNNGTIAVANALPAFSGDPMGTLTINGNYDGIGNLVIRTQLGADDSPTDVLHITGDATGSTAVTVINAGGTGAYTTESGIRIIEVDGTSSATAFHLNQAVVVGPYEYGLFYGGVGANAGNQDWYLRSDQSGTRGPAPNSSTQTVLPYAEILSNYAEATLGTLQQRTGNRIWPNGATPETIWCKDPSRNFRCAVDAGQSSVYVNGGPFLYGAGAWGRIGGQYSSFEPQKGTSYTQKLGFMQAGYEGAVFENAYGLATLGAYATFGRSVADIDLTPDLVSGARRRGKITTDGYGLGLNTTWLGNNGFYADAIGQFTWYQSNLSNKAGGDSQGWSSVLSLEVGKRFDLGSGWAVVPQAQLAWTHVDFQSFNDIYGSRVSLGDGDSLKGRAGLRLEKLASWKSEDGQSRHLQLYGIANLSYEFLNGTKVDVAGVSFTQQEKKLWGEVGAGGTYAWNDKWSAYGEATYAMALSSHSGSDNYTVKGTAGLRYRW
ncbi:hypothetical protein LMIY3S_03377 [Labrys miyagiensis]